MEFNLQLALTRHLGYVTMTLPQVNWLPERGLL